MILSERQKEVFLLIMEGLSAEEIGRKLFITRATVNYHIMEAVKKTKTKNKITALLHLIKIGELEIKG